jgi:hypothetical protein
LFFSLFYWFFKTFFLYLLYFSLSRMDILWHTYIIIYSEELKSIFYISSLSKSFNDKSISSTFFYNFYFFFVSSSLYSLIIKEVGLFYSFIFVKIDYFFDQWLFYFEYYSYFYFIIKESKASFYLKLVIKSIYSS